MMNKKINFSNLFTKANFFSLILVILSLIFVIFKGLNFGIDFKGGTLIEIRADKQYVNSKIIRDSLCGTFNALEFSSETVSLTSQSFVPDYAFNKGFSIFFVLKQLACPPCLPHLLFQDHLGFL